MAQQEVARPKDRDRNDELNRVDCGDGHPGGDLSAGIVGEVVSEEQAQGKTVNRIVGRGADELKRLRSVPQGLKPKWLWDCLRHG
jgi:hypothetical protein